jgi:two-component system sensor histidine kinase RegB
LARAQTTRQERLTSLVTLAAGAAHELATPLSTIAVVAKDLERDMQKVEKQAQATDDVRLIRREVERCRDILSRMRNEAGDAAGEPFVPVTIGALINKVVEEQSGTGPAVRSEVPSDLAACQLIVPSRAVGQALHVLLKNARDASPSGRDVSLRVERDHDYVRFEIRDEGIGMEPAVLARVGEPFFTTKPAGQGMGLGVFLARAVAERLGGTLSVASVVGQGTLASLSLSMPKADPVE